MLASLLFEMQDSAGADTVVRTFAKEIGDARLNELGYPQGRNAALFKTLLSERDSSPYDEVPTRLAVALHLLTAQGHMETYLAHGMLWEAANCAAASVEADYDTHMREICARIAALTPQASGAS